MSNEEFTEQKRPLAQALSTWALSWASQSEIHGFLPRAHSNAIEELAAETRWSAPNWLEPVRNAHSYGHMLSYVLAEHLAALVAVIEHTTVGPAFSFVPSARAIFGTSETAEPASGFGWSRRTGAERVLSSWRSTTRYLAPRGAPELQHRTSGNAPVAPTRHVIARRAVQRGRALL